jgi:TetR/AcrR family transcriptional repressor of nem operon
MKISKAQAEANRAKVVETASGLFREKGFDGVAVGELMAAAGFTHGGFYNHFYGKAELVAAALDQAFRMMDQARAGAGDLSAMLRLYLSEAARRAPARSCPAAALANDTARQGEPVKRVFAEGLERMIGSIAEGMPDGPERRARAIGVLVRMTGALSQARATPDGDGLGSEILRVALAQCLEEARADQAGEAGPWASGS